MDFSEIWPIWGWLATKGPQVFVMAGPRLWNIHDIGPVVSRIAVSQTDYIQTNWQEAGLTALSSNPTTKEVISCPRPIWTCCVNSHNTGCSCTTLALYIIENEPRLGSSKYIYIYIYIYIERESVHLSKYNIVFFHLGLGVRTKRVNNWPEIERASGRGRCSGRQWLQSSPLLSRWWP